MARNDAIGYGYLYYNLTISEVGVDVPAVPEPATWAMMLLGFGLVGGALRSNRHRQKMIAA